jgi:hypothetical protein
MSKLILLSVVILSIALPMVVAARPKPQATLRQVVFIMVFAILVWSQLCLRVYPQYVPLK